MANFVWNYDIQTVKVWHEGWDTKISRSRAGRRQASVSSAGGGFWKFNLTLRPRERNDFDYVWAFLNKQEGRYGTFELEIPKLSSCKTGYQNSIIVQGASQSGKSINVDGMALSQTILKTGDFIKFTNSTKVYQLTEDLISSGGGAGTLVLHMPVVDTPVDNEAVIFNNVKWTVSNSSDSVEVDLDLLARNGWSLELEEVF